MSTPGMASRNSRQATDWAAKRRDQLDRASRVRQDRANGVTSSDAEPAGAGAHAPWPGARAQSQPAADGRTRTEAAHAYGGGAELGVGHGVPSHLPRPASEQRGGGAPYGTMHGAAAAAGGYAAPPADRAVPEWAAGLGVQSGAASGMSSSFVHTAYQHAPAHQPHAQPQYQTMHASADGRPVWLQPSTQQPPGGGGGGGRGGGAAQGGYGAGAYAPYAQPAGGASAYEAYLLEHPRHGPGGVPQMSSAMAAALQPPQPLAAVHALGAAQAGAHYSSHCCAAALPPTASELSASSTALGASPASRAYGRVLTTPAALDAPLSSYAAHGPYGAPPRYHDGGLGAYAQQHPPPAQPYQQQQHPQPPHWLSHADELPPSVRASAASTVSARSTSAEGGAGADGVFGGAAAPFKARRARASGRRTGSAQQRPEWNSDFASASALSQGGLGSGPAGQSPDDPMVPAAEEAAAPARAAGRRAAPPAGGTRPPRPEWNSDFSTAGPQEWDGADGAGGADGGQRQQRRSGRRAPGSGEAEGGAVEAEQGHPAAAPQPSQTGALRALKERQLHSRSHGGGGTAGRAPPPAQQRHARDSGSSSAPDDGAGGSPPPPPMYADRGAAEEMVACQVCARTFGAARIGAHERICSRVKDKRRPEFVAQYKRAASTSELPAAHADAAAPPRADGRRASFSHGERAGGGVGARSAHSGGGAAGGAGAGKHPGGPGPRDQENARRNDGAAGGAARGAAARTPDGAAGRAHKPASREGAGARGVNAREHGSAPQAPPSAALGGRVFEPSVVPTEDAPVVGGRGAYKLDDLPPEAFAPGGGAPPAPRAGGARGAAARAGGVGAGPPPGGADYDVMADEPRVPCPLCARHFAASRLARHQEACAKAASKKRPKFDPSKQRLPVEAQRLHKDTERAARRGGGAAGARAGGGAAAREQQALRRKPKWKIEHEQFQAALRANRQIVQAEKAGVPLSSLPQAPTNDELDTRVQCPNCGRKFNEMAASRHMPLCAGIRAKPKMLTRGSGGMSSSVRKPVR